jgi:peptide subunit release factor RF-3
MEKPYRELIETEMTRRNFLKFLAGGALVLFGINNLISYVLQFKASPKAEQSETRRGFGSSKFGV